MMTPHPKLASCLTQHPFTREVDPPASAHLIFDPNGPVWLASWHHQRDVRFRLASRSL